MLTGRSKDIFEPIQRPLQSGCNEAVPLKILSNERGSKYMHAEIQRLYFFAKIPHIQFYLHWVPATTHGSSSHM